MILKEGIIAECRKIFRNFPEVNTENHATLRVTGVQAKTEPKNSWIQVSAITPHIRVYWLTPTKASFTLWTRLRPVQRIENILCLYLNAAWHKNHHAHERVLCERFPRRKQSDYHNEFAYAFAKLRKTTISVDMSVRPSLCPQGTGPPLDGFSRTLNLSTFRKLVDKIQVSLKSDKNNGCFTWRPIYIYDISLNFSYDEKCSRQRCREKLNIHFTCNNLFRRSCRLWNNV